MPNRRSRSDGADTRWIRMVASWFTAEATGKKSVIGIANAGLKVIEHFRLHYPLAPEHYLSRGGSQVKGLSGRSGDRIIARFLSGMRPLGTEAGRTSRGTPQAARRLAAVLNSAASGLAVRDVDRNRAADAMQQWLIDNPIKDYFARDRLQPAFNPRHSFTANIRALLNEAFQRHQGGQVAQHVVGAKLALRFPDIRITNFSYSTADVPTNRPGDFVVASTVFHVTMAGSSPLMKKCKQNIRQGYRVILLVPESRREGAAQIVAGEQLDNLVTVLALETFIGQNMDELAAFNQQNVEEILRRLLELYNSRVVEVEPDPSLQIEIPATLAAR